MKGTILLLTSLTAAYTSQAAVVTLLDEEFTNGNAPANTATATWSQTDPAAFEAYANGGFAVRGINSGVPPSPMGGLEVLAAATTNTVTISITLPALLDDTQDGTFTFLAGQRIGGGSSGGFEGDLEIVNITDARTLRAKAAVNHPNYTMAANNENLDFIAADAGDTIELRFYESGGGSDRGLQLADLQLDVTTIPEPSSSALLGLGGLALILRRRK
ncbi:PEP-CTERM sorting domain-containing protein [Verrucomicrobiaceae bacterium N1E253]|uniref:PEP-CTERM sorting domain-containing protein n=1 Tax=Oceaniferula marina TaxID=2748318 RepID=A0A851GQ30_9BACT|nr:PEP-CTERM sorting domain-containing protein [Oceaniferula marina]NWK56930.1 PEP-CTERM sorting domain-containing protein [Oceaniferula marina]